MVEVVAIAVIGAVSDPVVLAVIESRLIAVTQDVVHSFVLIIFVGTVVLVKGKTVVDPVMAAKVNLNVVFAVFDPLVFDKVKSGVEVNGFFRAITAATPGFKIAEAWITIAPTTA